MSVCEPTIPPATASDIAALDARLDILETSYYWVWANAAARNSQVVSAAEVGKIGYQTDMAREHRLVSQTAGVGRWAPLPDPRCYPPAYAKVVGGATTFSGVGLGPSSQSGSAGTRAQTNTNAATFLLRFSQATAVGTGTSALVRGGTTSGVLSAGGVRWRIREVFGSVVTTSMKWAMGFILQSSAQIITNVDLLARTDCVFIGRPTGTEANLHLWYNDSADACTDIDLASTHGVTMPADAAQQGYEFSLYSADGTSYSYQVRNINNGHECSGVLTTNIPAATVPLVYLWFANNNLDSSSIAIDPVDVMLEQVSR